MIALVHAPEVGKRRGPFAELKQRCHGRSDIRRSCRKEEGSVRGIETLPIRQEHLRTLLSGERRGPFSELKQRCHGRSDIRHSWWEEEGFGRRNETFPIRQEHLRSLFVGKRRGPFAELKLTLNHKALLVVRGSERGGVRSRN